MGTDIYLRTFSADELILDTEETRQALKFFFPTDAPSIDDMPVNDNLRAFAQALLVAGIDASYAMGYVEALFKSLRGGSPAKVVKAFGKKAARHWFKHANASNLMDAEIYTSVRNALSLRFRSDLRSFLAAAPRHEIPPTLAWRSCIDAKGSA
ncbi:hypothetical protein [Pseudomonas sp. RIT-PI-AD]|uniref:hypothetical protein n=1 Tax=Pseudomonas sp. RIT-PI-AD TaxID=3035294 RepID=UPI0021D97FC5|nr:hypothetical protein [Pseudomonas sp. RIT-PI-AD]